MARKWILKFLHCVTWKRALDSNDSPSAEFYLGEGCQAAKAA